MLRQQTKSQINTAQQQMLGKRKKLPGSTDESIEF